MNGKEFGNIIDYTIKHMPEDLKGNSVGIVKEIFRNCGVEFYKGSLNEVKEVLETNDYMSWETCEAEDVKDLADNGVAVVGIKDDEIFIVAPETHLELEEGHENIRKMSELDEDTIDGITFFAATNTATGGGSTIPKRIAQFSTDPQWKKELWKCKYGEDHSGSASSGCGVACISMALSCIGISVNPGDIIHAQGSSYISDWGLFCKTYTKTKESGAVDTALNNYKKYPDRYAPPIVLVSSSPHYAVVCGYNNDKTKFMAIDPGERGYDKKNGVEVHYLWTPVNGQQVIQYRKN